MQSHPAPSRHTVYGLTLETWIPFPELEPAQPGANVDVVVRLGDVPAELEGWRHRGARYQTAPGRMLAWLDDVARYLVIDGREIIIHPAKGSTESDLRLFLLTSPMGALLLQRDCLPLHASAIATERGAVVFMGPSGVGKSTIAAAFQQRGFRVLADDISVIHFAADGTPWVMPGLPRFKLWPDAVARLGSTADELARLRPQLEKRSFPFQEGFHPEPLPLEHIVVLQIEGRRKSEVRPITGLEKVPQLLTNTYRRKFVSGLGLAASHFGAVSRLAAVAKMTVASRMMDEEHSRVTERIAAEIGL